MKRILVGLDASPRSKDVLDVGVRLAKGLGAKLILFRGVGIPIEIPHEAYSIEPASLGDLLEASAKAYLDDVAKSLPAGLVERVHVALGTPWQTICKAAKDENVDLIIIGSHGYDALDHLIGTTAGRVVNHADRSVLVVRAADRVT